MPVRTLFERMADTAREAARKSGDPDLGQIGPGHVCKHGIRHPHPCDDCERDIWNAARQN